MPDRLKNIEVLKTESGRRYYKNVIYPDIPLHEDDVYVITTGTDRYDTLALQFYGDSKLWWIIATANVSKKDGLSVQQGVQLRIPTNPGRIINLFNDLNENR